MSRDGAIAVCAMKSLRALRMLRSNLCPFRFLSCSRSGGSSTISWSIRPNIRFRYSLFVLSSMPVTSSGSCRRRFRSRSASRTPGSSSNETTTGTDAVVGTIAPHRKVGRPSRRVQSIGNPSRCCIRQRQMNYQSAVVGRHLD